MADNTETLGIRLNLQGLPETSNGLAFVGRNLDNLGARADAAAPRLGGVAKSSKEVQAAMRLLPAQITDVVTSLASGQPAWLVAIQQGGQIKDSFGGIGPAFRAVTQAAGPMNLALGGVAAGLGLVILAHQKGQREALNYERALADTGNAGGNYSERMADIARETDAVVGTQRAAAEAVTALAASGQVAARDMGRFTELSVRLERSMGKSYEDTAQVFKELGRAPLEASDRLNASLNHLTASQREQIRVLMAMGEETQAAHLAQTAYADAMEQRSQQVEARLGLLQKAWRGVGDIAAETWDAMLGLGREKTTKEKLDEIERRLAGAGSGRLGGALGRQAQAENERTLIPQRDALNRALLNQEERRLRDMERQEDDKEKIRLDGAAAIAAANAVELAQARAAATALEGQEALRQARAQSGLSARERLAQREIATLDSLREREALGTSDYYERRAAAEQRALQARAVVVDGQIASEQRLAQSRVAVIDAEIAAESRRKPENQDQGLLQRARLLELAAQRNDALVQSEARVVDLRNERAQITEDLARSEIEAQRRMEAASSQATDRFLADVSQRRQAVVAMAEQLRVSNAYQAANLQQDPRQRVIQRAAVDRAELERAVAERTAGLRARQAQLEVLQPDAAAQVGREIQDLEQQKADAIVLINRQMVEDLKPEWQRMLEGWNDNTRLMRDSWDEFQTGWLQAGEQAWAQYGRTGRLSLSSLKDFIGAQAGQFLFRSQIAPMFAKVGQGIAGLLGIENPGGGAAGAAGETAARVAMNSALTLGTVAVNSLASAASAAAAALAAVGGSGGGSSGLGGLGSLVGSWLGFDTGGSGITSGNVGLADLGLGGGRAFGGGVQPGGLHPVNENGMPELLKVGGQSYLMMGGEGGQVTPLKPQGSGGLGGGNSIVFAPQMVFYGTQNQAEFMGMVSQGMEAAKQQLVEEMDRRMR